ncbi:hypothetical protein OF83DRAFT_501546 [Amylostereum chailletii]|nr:hypothetical protein OF83DRAFT_501546 [Amylostereum chailletii]
MSFSQSQSYPLCACPICTNATSRTAATLPVTAASMYNVPPTGAQLCYNTAPAASASSVSTDVGRDNSVQAVHDSYSTLIIGQTNSSERNLQPSTASGSLPRERFASIPSYNGGWTMPPPIQYPNFGGGVGFQSGDRAAPGLGVPVSNSGGDAAPEEQLFGGEVVGRARSEGSSLPIIEGTQIVWLPDGIGYDIVTRVRVRRFAVHATHKSDTLQYQNAVGGAAVQGFRR